MPDRQLWHPENTGVSASTETVRHSQRCVWHLQYIESLFESQCEGGDQKQRRAFSEGSSLARIRRALRFPVRSNP